MKEIKVQNKVFFGILIIFWDNVTWLVIYLLTASDHYGTVNACDSFVGNEKVLRKYRICTASLLQIDYNNIKH